MDFSVPEQQLSPGHKLGCSLHHVKGVGQPGLPGLPLCRSSLGRPQQVPSLLPLVFPLQRELPET